MEAGQHNRGIKTVLVRALMFMALVVPLGVWFYATWELFFIRHAGPNFSGDIASHLRLKNKDTFRLAVMGDVRGNTTVMETILDGAESNYDAAVILGDLAHWPNRARFGFINRQIIRSAGRMPVFTVIGNHDLNNKTDSGDYFREYFGPDHYWWRFGGVAFIAINNVEPDRWESELKWLDKTLRERAAGARRIMLMMHEPPSVTEGFYGMTVAKSEQLRAVISERAKVTILASHFHGYMEYDFHGVPVYVTGEGGAPQKKQPPTYGYLSMECSADDCRLSRVNLGYIPTGYLYVKKFVFIYFYYCWPLLSLGIGIIYFRKKRRANLAEQSSSREKG